jgi:hypothetical protein
MMPSTALAGMPSSKPRGYRAALYREWCVKVAGPVMKGELQMFEADQLDDAWDSVKS